MACFKNIFSLQNKNGNLSGSVLKRNKVRYHLSLTSLYNSGNGHLLHMRWNCTPWKLKAHLVPSCSLLGTPQCRSLPIPSFRADLQGPCPVQNPRTQDSLPGAELLTQGVAVQLQEAQVTPGWRGGQMVLHFRSSLGEGVLWLMSNSTLMFLRAAGTTPGPSLWLEFPFRPCFVDGSKVASEADYFR